jgi:hypothetical protein
MVPLLVASALAAAPPVTSTGVAHMIATYGPNGAVERLIKPTKRHPMFGDYEAVLDGISSGKAQWLALAPELQKGADAGPSEFLKISVAEALPHNAAGVLRLGAHGWPIANACSYPMLEPRPADTRRYFAKAIPAVAAVRDPTLQSARAICLTELRKAQKNAAH